jgi:uncharacterized damage-inducible protein DinB
MHTYLHAMESKSLHDALIKEVLFRLYDEALPRILTCLDQLSNEQIWWRPNESSNSIGNLILHLSGNVRQWIGSGLGSLPDHRKRQIEFDERRPIDKERLVSDLLSNMAIAKSIISEVTTADLLKKRAVQTFQETGVTILIHVTEHFSYHTGQIAYITKMLKDRSLDFYAGVPLE